MTASGPPPADAPAQSAEAEAARDAHSSAPDGTVLPELEDAKRAFERAHSHYLTARKLCEELAEDVVTTGDRMTAAYHVWQRQRSAQALADNAGRRAPVFELTETSQPE